MQVPVSIVIVNYNKLAYTKLCLDSILQARPLPAQVICVDNGSTDGTADYLENVIPAEAEQAEIEYVLILNDSNMGACTARNQGLDVVDEAFISFCDNDVAVRSRNWLHTLHTALNQDQNIGIVGPKLVFPFEPYNIECAGVAISPTGRVQYRGRGKPIDSPEFNEPQEVQCLISACWLMKREITDTLGGLDEIYNPV